MCGSQRGCSSAQAVAGSAREQRERLHDRVVGVHEGQGCQNHWTIHGPYDSSRRVGGAAAVIQGRQPPSFPFPPAVDTGSEPLQAGGQGACSPAGSDDGSSSDSSGCDSDARSIWSSSSDSDALHETHVAADAEDLPGVWQSQERGVEKGLRGRLRTVANRLIRGNRFGNLPDSYLLGVEQEKLPLHMKDVETIDIDRLRALPFAHPTLSEQWDQVWQWLRGTHPTNVRRGKGTEANVSADEMKRLLELEHVEPTTVDQVRSTCDVFPVLELSKGRRRLIKHTKWLNERFGREFLLGVKLLRTYDLAVTVHRGTFCDA
eukprot:PhM_4_TR13291/c1_g2_i2/m.92127